MFDWNDANDVSTDAVIFGPGGWFGLIFVLIVVGIAFAVASSNDKDCHQITCPNNQPAQLLEHECKCVDPAPRQP